jgi:hypothetical protein
MLSTLGNGMHGPVRLSPTTNQNLGVVLPNPRIDAYMLGCTSGQSDSPVVARIEKLSLVAIRSQLETFNSWFQKQSSHYISISLLTDLSR